MRERVAEVVVGQDTVVERMMIALLTGGHLLLVGVPGIAKTLLVNAVAKAVDLKFSRVQFTIDMLPSDILAACFKEWVKSAPARRRIKPTAVQKVEQIINAQDDLPKRQQDPLWAYQMICQIVSERK